MTYQPQPNFQNSFNFQVPPDVSLKDAEWVCQNPKTKDMMIIATGDSPAKTGEGPYHQQQGVWVQQPGSDGLHPSTSLWPGPPSDQAPQPSQPQLPSIPQPTESADWTANQGLLIVTGEPGKRATQWPKATTSNPIENHGEGVIDIRLGNQ
ncbi:hypothetical protein QAD02_006463 [Eretmocerus hayati]|uniref:Uncharacterized protein n=1 Tax=Eretmocerus hayati TaxID=131215 RepID=A0ACC2N1S8_9HYME|nr:hypothetical protein QAD02_006463 [Eretmocerus hayati]